MAFRWTDEATKALQLEGFSVVEIDGEDDYQGWVVILAASPSGWATLSWSYGTCSGCDAYEDMSEEEAIASLRADIDRHASEEDARRAFANKKHW